MELTIFIPMLATQAGRALAELVDARSAIVGRADVPLAEVGGGDDGRPEENGRDAYEVYFEGNRYNAVNLRTFADRVRHAANRLVVSYPTIARATVRRIALAPVGTYDTNTRVIRLNRLGESGLMLWLGMNRDELGIELQVAE